MLNTKKIIDTWDNTNAISLWIRHLTYIILLTVGGVMGYAVFLTDFNLIWYFTIIISYFGFVLFYLFIPYNYLIKLECIKLEYISEEKVLKEYTKQWFKYVEYPELRAFKLISTLKKNRIFQDSDREIEIVNLEIEYLNKEQSKSGLIGYISSFFTSIRSIITATLTLLIGFIINSWREENRPLDDILSNLFFIILFVTLIIVVTAFLWRQIENESFNRKEKIDNIIYILKRHIIKIKLAGE